MIVRNPCEIDDPEWYPLLESGYHGGCIGPEVECEVKPSRRRIGFRMPDKPEPMTPDWLLL